MALNEHNGIEFPQMIRHDSRVPIHGYSYNLYTFVEYLESAYSFLCVCVFCGLSCKEKQHAASLLYLHVNAILSFTSLNVSPVWHSIRRVASNTKRNGSMPKLESIPHRVHELAGKYCMH